MGTYCTAFKARVIIAQYTAFCQRERASIHMDKRAVFRIFQGMCLTVAIEDYVLKSESAA